MEKIKIKFYNKISVRVVTAVVVVFVAVLFIDNQLATNYSRNRLTTAEVANLENIAVEKGTALEQYILDQKIMAQQVAEDSLVVEAALKFKNSGEIDTQLQNSIAANLKTLSNRNGNIYENLFVTVGTTGFADCLDNVTLHDVGEENFYIQCQNNGYFFGNNISPVTGRPVYVIAYSILNPANGEKIGSLNMSIDMSSLGSAVISTIEYQVAVLDKDGIMIATNGNPDDILTDISEIDPTSFNNILATGKGNMLLDLTMFGQGINYLAYYTTNNFVIEVQNPYKNVIAAANEMGKNLTIVSGAFSLIGMALLAIFVSIVIKPVKKAADDVEEVLLELNQGRGDLTKSFKIKRQDEVGILVSAVNKLMENMAIIISNVQKTVENIIDSSDTMNHDVEDSEMELNNVSATMQQMSASSEETSASMSQVMQQVSQVANLVQNVNKQSTQQADFADKVVAKVEGIKAQSAKEREIANIHLNEVTQKLHTKIENAKQVQEIANLTAEILNITSKTNLLALNASIEAARAGEAGKGFAVVADEIRQLADSSQGAANRIQEVTNNVIIAVEDLADEASTVTDYMIQNNEKNHESTDSLTESYSNDISSLSQSMSDFKRDSDEIRNAMDAISEAVDAVNIAAEETASGITNVAQSTSDLSKQLENVVEKSNENVTEINGLSEMMNKYKV